MGGMFEINDGGIVISHMGGKIILGCNGSPEPSVVLPELSPEEQVYGRNLCYLPVGWADLTGDANWQHHLSAELRKQWPTLNLEQKMAVAYTIGELSDELTNRAYEHAW